MERSRAIQDQLPHRNDDTKVPVLVFWKRQVIKDAIRYDGQSCTDKDVTSGDCDSFVYSLVAYHPSKITKIRTPFGLALLGSAGFKLKMACKILYPVDNYGNPRYIEGHEPDKGF